MMGMAKQLGAELLSSGGKKNKSGKSSGEMSDTKAMKEALKLAKHKGDQKAKNLSIAIFGVLISDLKQIDPRVLDYAASRVQAGFRGWQTRQNLKKGL